MMQAKKTPQTKPIAVIKVGGDMLVSKKQRQGLAANIQGLLAENWHCVVVHGGGPQINALQSQYGLQPTKVQGRRITTKEDLLVVKQALCGQVNVELVATLIAGGVPAFGYHGASGSIIQASKRPPMDFGDDGLVDLGEVGDVHSINHDLIHTLLHANQVPVIASLGVSSSGQIFNINADTTASAIAKSLAAGLLILSTNVGGVYRDISQPDSRIAEMTFDNAEQLITEGVITDGMVPKVREAFALLEHGVAKIVITNANQADTYVNIVTNQPYSGTTLVVKT